MELLLHTLPPAKPLQSLMAPALRQYGLLKKLGMLRNKKASVKLAFK